MDIFLFISTIKVEEILEEEDLNKTQRAEEMSSKPNLDLIKVFEIFFFMSNVS